MDREAEGLYGVKKCLGCGYCCKTAPCGLAMRLGLKKYTSTDRTCEFLVPVDGRYRCSLYLDGSPGRQAFVAAELAFGAGCCSPLFNTDREKLLERKD